MHRECQRAADDEEVASVRQSQSIASQQGSSEQRDQGRDGRSDRNPVAEKALEQRV